MTVQSALESIYIIVVRDDDIKQTQQEETRQEYHHIILDHVCPVPLISVCHHYSTDSKRTRNNYGTVYTRVK